MALPGTAATIGSRASWASALLAAINAPITQNNIDTIVAWETAEGGAGPQFGVPNNVTNYNPLNITLTTGPQGYGYDPGSGTFYAGASPTPGNSPPVASFSDWGTGVQATAARIEQPFASGILAALQSNASTQAVASAVGSSGWGTGDFASVAPVNASAQLTSAPGGGAPTAGGGQGGAPYTPSSVPGVPATPPPLPDFTLNPYNELSRVLTWTGEFGAWAIFIFVVFLFGALLMVLGLVILVVLFAAPVAAPVAAAVTGRTPVGRVVKGASNLGARRQQAQASNQRAQNTATRLELQERRVANQEGARARRTYERGTSTPGPGRQLTEAERARRRERRRREGFSVDRQPATA